MAQQLRSALTTLLKIGVAAGLIAYLFLSGKVDVHSLRTLLTPAVLIGGLTTSGLILYVASERWRLLLTQQGLPSRMGETYKLTLIGTFFNFFVPGGVGGDVVKAVLLSRNYPGKKAQAVLTVLADRILGLFTMTFLALVSFVFEYDLLMREESFRYIFAGLLFLFVAFIVTFWILLSAHAAGLRAKVGQLLLRVPKLHKLWIFAQSYHLSKSEIAKLFVLSILGQMGSITLFWVVATQLPGPVPPLTVFLFAVPIGFMVTAVPIAPAGIGIGQAAFLYLFSKAQGVETNLGVIGITAFQAFQLIFGLVGAALFVWMKRQDPKISIEDLESQGAQV